MKMTLSCEIYISYSTQWAKVNKLIQFLKSCKNVKIKYLYHWIYYITLSNMQNIGMLNASYFGQFNSGDKRLFPKFPKKCYYS